MSISLRSSLWDGFGAARGFWSSQAVRSPPWGTGAGLDSADGLEWELDKTGEGLAWLRFPACSQRFFRALRFADRREGEALSDTYKGKYI